MAQKLEPLPAANVNADTGAIVAKINEIVDAVNAAQAEAAKKKAK